MGELASTGSAPVEAHRPTLEILVMRIQTAFTSEDAFVAAFRRFCTETTCFIPTTTPRAVGIETGFSIRLADGTPMLRGLCVVLDAWSDDDNPYRRPGVRLGIRTLTRETKPIFDRLREARLATGSSPDIAAQLTAQLAAQLGARTVEMRVPPYAEDDEQARATVEMPPLFPELPAEDCTHEDAAEAMDAVPLPIDPQDTSATQRVLLDTIPMRAPAPTLLGVAPINATEAALGAGIALPRTLTPRERVTMPALDATGEPVPHAPPPAVVVADDAAVIVDAPAVDVVPAPRPQVVATQLVRPHRTWWGRFTFRLRTWARTIVWGRRRRRAERMP